jgi:hypothetical protein
MSKAFALIQKTFAIFFLASFFITPFVYAGDMTSTSFIIRDPLIGTGGSYGSSASFQAFGSGDMTTIGRSTSASFEGRYGFLWYPYVTQGAFTATPNGSQADLSWGASTAGLGWSVSGYKTGIKPTGGSYSYTTHGLITSYSYTGLTPGGYCFILQTLDAFSNVIATSQEECITIQAVLTFSISSNSIDFGTLSTSGPRYATTTGGSGTNSVAHTMSASSNAGSGYTITYFGPTLTSGSNNITPATITNDADGTPGSSQFALSLSSSGSASITSAYNQASGSGNWKFVDSTVETIANTSGVTTTETFSNRYLSNISSTTPAGAYSTSVTYVITGNF